MNKLLSGNEAIARGAHEAGVRLAAAYPGTPSTEILENIVQYPEIYSEWAPNEKVALEVGIGASLAGTRALVTMKHVGVNVAADPLFTASYTGVRGGLVLVTADDPEMHSSQNEQDNRNYARFAKLPMLEPADSQEAKDFVGLGFELSERFDTPVLLRTTTRIAHAKTVVTLQEPRAQQVPDALQPDAAKFVMLPRNARARHPVVEERLAMVAQWADESEINQLLLQDRSVGIIAAGVCYQYARESYPQASFLKLGMSYPLPQQKIRQLAAHVERLYVFEELDPFFEEQIKALGVTVTGKEVFPVCGEFSPATAIEGIDGSAPVTTEVPVRQLPARPPNMCPGCPHRGVFYTLKKLKAFVTGDIGCYTLGALPPLQAMHSCICMGASIGNAMGITKALGPASEARAVAVIGDSTFLHSGMTGLLDVAYNNGACTVIILDNRTTAMTGRQEHPGTGYTLQGEPARQVEYAQLCTALGIEHVVTVDPYDLEQLHAVISTEMARPAPSVVITRAPCVLHRRDRAADHPVYVVDADTCIGCRACLQLGCPAIEWQPADGSGIAQINAGACTGCAVCAQVCVKQAITPAQ